jgi:hypothetical protein
MPVFDFAKLLREEGIDFIQRGKNVKRGELNIRCPFCASADPSHHMGLNLSTGQWACWRNAEHRGKSPLRLLVKLLNVSYWRAREIAGLDRDYIDPDGFSSLVARLKSTGWSTAKAPERAPEKLQTPSAFRPLTWGVATRRHMDYLIQRGFDERDADSVAYDYALQGATSGRWAHRVILPYFLDGELVTWTGRAITPSEYRYLDLAVEDSLIPPKQTLYNYDALIAGGEWLVVVEGPIDALKLDYYGKPYGVRAVGLSTNSMTEDQLYMLAEGMCKFKHLGVMMDNAGPVSVVDGMRLRQQLTIADPTARILPVPGKAKDAGDATPSQIQSFSEELVRA